MAGDGRAVVAPLARADLSETGLTLPSDMTFDEWVQCGETLRRIDRGVQWWIGDWLNAGEQRWGETYSQAIEVAEREYQTLAEYKWVAAAIDVSVRTETLSWNVHRQIAAMPAEQRAGAIRQAEAEQWTVRDARKAVRRLKAQQVAREAQQLPAGKFRVIYADPPWSYGNEMAEYATTPEDHYPQMSTEDICDLTDHAGRSVLDLRMPDCVLFLWATCPLMPDALHVIDAWGFAYKAQFVWDKVRHNMGHYNSVRHELLLVATRGSCTPEEQRLFDSVHSEERTAHSRKPEHFHEVIETLYPSGPRIELFAREPRAGWEAWGNE